jgi:SAM-dependent methyltransferase
MHISRLAIPIPMPDWLYRPLKGVQTRLLKPQASKKSEASAAVNLTGDRDIEWSWIAARIPDGPGEALDFGAGESFLGLLATHRGFRVTAVDLTSVRWMYRVPRLTFRQGDIFRMKYPRGKFDLVMNCSTVEHAGLAGRYGVAEERPDGDLEAMRILAGWMKPKGIMLLTIPVGRDEVFAPLCRVYGKRRLPLLLAGFRVLEETYWIKGEDNIWVRGSRAAALGTQTYAGSWNPLRNYYPIGCFLLQKTGR